MGRLVSIGDDDNHWIAVWEWEKVVKSGGIGKEPMLSGTTGKGFVNGIVPHPSGGVVTFGPQYVKFWTLSGKTPSGKAGSFGAGRTPKQVMCVACTADGVSAVAGDGGQVFLFQFDGSLQASVEAHAVAVGAICVAEMGGEARFVSAGYDGKLKVWSTDMVMQDEVELSTSDAVVAGAAMGQDVKGIRGCARAIDMVDGRVVIGTRDNEVYEMSMESKQVSRVTAGHVEELWGLAMHPSQPVYVTAGDDKVLRCWDTTAKRGMEGKILGLPYMVRSMVFSPDGKQIAIGFKEGALGGSVPVSIVDFETLGVVHEIMECDECVAAVKYSPDGQWFAAGSWDQKLYLYDVQKGYKLMYVFGGNSSSIEHVMFTADSRVVMSNSKDTQTLYWEVATGARIERASMLRDAEWSQWTAVLGWSALGIWDPDYDQTDVNATCQSNEGSVLVLGDDYGQVKLLRYPSPVDAAEYVSYGGHSSHVTNVRFAHDDSCIVSTGGGDMAVFQWSYKSASTCFDEL